MKHEHHIHSYLEICLLEHDSTTFEYDDLTNKIQIKGHANLPRGRTVVVLKSVW